MNVATRTEISLLDLASGTGMLGEAVAGALGVIGIECRTACYVEWTAEAAACLVARMAATGMGDAPVWDDAHRFDGRPWRGTVDCVVAGYPCQPFSQSGSRRGEHDPRDLWPTVHRIIGETMPGIVFLENVSGHLSLGWERTVWQLASLGYRVTPGLFSSEEVGAPHRRERLFMLGRLGDAGHGNSGRCPETVTEGHWTNDGISRTAGGRVADAGRDGRREDTPWRESERRIAIAGGSAELADTPSDRREAGPYERSRETSLCRQAGSEPGTVHSSLPVGNAECAGSQRRESAHGDTGNAGSTAEPGRALGYYPPPRDVDVAAVAQDMAKTRTTDEARAIATAAVGTARKVFGDWAAVARVDASRMPAIESALCGMVDGLASRSDQLRLTGNGVDTLAAAHAFLALWARSMHDDGGLT